MKKILALALIASLCFTLVGCNDKKEKNETDQKDQVELGESEGESPIVEIQYDKTISVQYKNKNDAVLYKYNYFKDDKLVYYLYEYRFDNEDAAKNFYNEKSVLNSNDIKVTNSEETVFLTYINPTEKGKSYQELLDSFKADPSVINYNEQ